MNEDSTRPPSEGKFLHSFNALHQNTPQNISMYLKDSPSRSADRKYVFSLAVKRLKQRRPERQRNICPGAAAFHGMNEDPSWNTVSCLTPPWPLLPKELDPHISPAADSRLGTTVARDLQLYRALDFFFFFLPRKPFCLFYS